VIARSNYLILQMSELCLFMRVNVSPLFSLIIPEYME
jgi:hypothetical protein